MNISMKVAPADALHGDFSRDREHPGWVQGWGVIKGPPDDREFAGIFTNRHDAEAVAAKAGSGFAARWGSYNENTQDYITGDT